MVCYLGSAYLYLIILVDVGPSAFVETTTVSLMLLNIDASMQGFFRELWFVAKL